MNWHHYLLLFLVGLTVPVAIASSQHLPGYMDADYYYGGGVQLAVGKGFTEPYLWNYLDDPKGLPHPSHTYWMPLASLVSAFGMWISGQITYPAGRLPFILLSSCVPLLTAALAYALTRKPLLAMGSGFLSIFSLYYAPFMPVPDNYAIFMLLGTSFLLLAPRREGWIPLVHGLLAGLMTLARNDGLLWMGVAGLTILWKSARTEDGATVPFRKRLASFLSSGLLALVGYLVVMGPWHLRNLNVFGSPMTPGSGRLLWVQNYNETFIYPANQLTPASFLKAGWDAAIQNRVRAFNSNFSNAIGAQGGIFLLPFILVGLWALRHDLRTKLAVTGWLVLFAVMTIVFPLAGSRGSFFHAGAAFQPYWWVAAPIGLDVIITWARSRGLFTEKAPLIFQGMLVVLAVFFTVYLVNIRVIQSGWPKDDYIYAAVQEMLIENGGRPEDVVIVRNPPGYYIVSESPAIALPYGDESTILDVAKRYHAQYLILEKNGTFEEIKDLYDSPQANPSFIYLGEVDGARLFRIESK